MTDANVRRVLACIFVTILIAGAYFLNHEENADTRSTVNTRIERVEPPCVRFGSNSDECYKSFSAAVELVKRNPELACEIVEAAGLTPDECATIKRQAARRHKDSSATSGAQSATEDGHAGGHQGENSTPQDTDAPAPNHPTAPAPGSPHQPNHPSGSPGGTAPEHPTDTAPPAANPVRPTPVPSSPPASTVPSPSPSPSTSSGGGHAVDAEVPAAPVEVCVGKLVGVNC